ncbi:helix-turn-helix domain-containing protein [Acidobacteria bacterium AB60]|nr:helix-turn-helix domain-containing protein [Acidobacteria bacterium AB60]
MATTKRTTTQSKNESTLGKGEELLGSNLLRPDEAAELLHTTQNALAIWRMRGTGPSYIKFGKEIRYTRRQLQEWVASRTVIPGLNKERVA